MMKADWTSLPIRSVVDNVVGGGKGRCESSPRNRPSQVSYPTPPMSAPPSPVKPPVHQQASSSNTIDLDQVDILRPTPVQPPQPLVYSVPPPTTPLPAASPLASMTGVALQPMTLAPPFYERAVAHSSYPASEAAGALARLPFSAPSPAHRNVATSTPGRSAPSAAAGPQSAVAESSSAAARAANARTGRKSKAHVASACINCKRAHLSCDDHRPCARCVSSGKQDTCYDVQHKKRGRPRLRDDSEFKVDRMVPEAARPTNAILSVPAESSANRPVTGTRSRRADSFRSLRSQGSDGSTGITTSPTYPYPQSSTARSSFEYPPASSYRPPSSVGPQGFEVPTAYVDVDFVILKANQPFWQIMLGGREAVGRNLGDIASPADGESFLTIRNRIRRERDARDPGYMAPMSRAIHEHVQSLSEADADHFTHGFDDKIYTWTQTQVGPPGQTFPVRVRLARTSLYFVAITLPSFRPVDPIPSAYPPATNRPPAPGPYYAAASAASRPQYVPPPGYPATAYPTQPQPYPQAAPMAGHEQSAYPHHSASQFHAAGQQPPAPMPPAVSYPSSSASTSYQDLPASRQPYRPTTPRTEASSSHDQMMYGSRRSSLATSPGRASDVVRLPPILSSPYSPNDESPRHRQRGSFDAGRLLRTPQPPPTTADQQPDAASSSYPAQASASAGQAGNDSDSDPDAARKRPRRMGIDDVLH